MIPAGPYRPADLPANLRHRIEVADAAHPRLGTPCWCWTGRINRNGYGRGWCVERKTEPVLHRLVFRLLAGVDVARGLLLDHLCRNRACCNPLHMDPVTPRENTARGEAVLFRPRLSNSGEFIERTHDNDV